jgi:hypothetical protein
VVILEWWITGLMDLTAGKEQSFQGMFMDGPHAFVVQRGAGATGRIAWGTRGVEVAIGIIDIPSFLRSAVAAGRAVAEECRARQWNCRDLEKLERSIVRSAV